MADKPHRVQLSRRKGWRMPENTVKVDRTTRFGNPYDWRDWQDDARSVTWALPTAAERETWCRQQAVEAFRADVRDGKLPDLTPLRGKNLACWCPPYPRDACHAEVLLELANKDPRP